MKRKVLLCTPELNLPGGYSALVKGLLHGFELNRDKIDFVINLYGKSSLNSNNFIRILLEIKQLIKYIFYLVKYQPDIIHFQTGFNKKNLLRDCIHLLFAKIFKIKVVIHAHGGEWHRFPDYNLFWKNLGLFWFEISSKIIVTSNEEFRIICEIFDESKKVIKINNPILMPTREAIQTHSSKCYVDKVKLIFASRLVMDKGILDYLQAIKMLNRNDFIAYIYGSGLLENDVRSFIDTNKLAHKIIFMGQVSLEDLIIAYKNSDIYVFPSYHLEGFPMAFFYALNCSLAIITTKVRPIPDFLHEFQNCLWIPEKDPIVLTKKIEYLIEHKNLIEKMKNNNLTLHSQFDIKVIMKEIISVYSELEN